MNGADVELATGVLEYLVHNGHAIRLRVQDTYCEQNQLFQFSKV
jgi:hypothetical protein